jgi:hypothetical protein
MRLLISLILLSGAWAQQPQPEPAKPKRMPQPKKLKEQKVSTAELINQNLTFNTALGVQCVHCHVKGDFASDENPKKDVGRMMIAMTEEINAKIGGSHPHVACYTCHRGEVEPKVNAPATPPPPPPPPPAPAP